MNKTPKDGNIYNFIDKQIGNLLEMSLNRKHKTVKVSQVIEILVEIEKRIPQIVIDGDELVKYFNKRPPKT